MLTVKAPDKESYIQLILLEQWVQDVFALNPDIKFPEEMNRRYSMAAHLAGMGKALSFVEWGRAIGITVETGEDEEALAAIKKFKEENG